MIRNCYRTSDIDAAINRITAMFGPHQIKPYGRGHKIAFEHSHVWLGDVCVNELAYGVELRNDIGEFNEQNFCVMLPCDGNYAITSDGKRIEGNVDSLTIINPDRPVTLDASDDYRNISVRISRHAINEALLNRTGKRVGDSVRFVPHPQALAAETRPLRDLIMRLWSSSVEENACNALGYVGSELESLIASMILTFVPNNYSDVLAPAAGADESAACRKAAEFLRRHAREDISLSQIVASSGLGKSALYAEFRKQYGVTPMTYLRNERLRLAHHALDVAHPNSISVTTVALNCGFQHFSRFAEYYRQRYGELPSVTLSRNRHRAFPR